MRTEILNLRVLACAAGMFLFAAAPQSMSSDEAAERLESLKSLHDRELITNEEYRDLRRKIIDQIVGTTPPMKNEHDEAQDQKGPTDAVLPGFGLALSTPTAVNEDTLAVPVVSVVPGGPADRAGIKTNDLILEVAGETISTLESVKRALDGAGGKPVLMLVKRGQDEQFVAIRGEGPPRTTAITESRPTTITEYGMELSETEEGIEILSIARDEFPSGSDLRAGDTIVGLHGYRISSFEEFMWALEKAEDDLEGTPSELGAPALLLVGPKQKGWKWRRLPLISADGSFRIRFRREGLGRLESPAPRVPVPIMIAAFYESELDPGLREFFINEIIEVETWCKDNEDFCPAIWDWVGHGVEALRTQRACNEGDNGACERLNGLIQRIHILTGGARPGTVGQPGEPAAGGGSPAVPSPQGPMTGGSKPAAPPAGAPRECQQFPALC